MKFRSLLLALPALLAPVRARGPTPLLGTKLAKVISAAAEPPHYKVREIIIQAEPDTSCPNGFEQSGGNCVQLDSVPPTLQCPPGWTLSDDGSTCMGYRVVAPEKTCDRGVAGTDRCIDEMSVPKILTCPEEFALVSDLSECVKDIPHSPVEICPPNVSIANGMCITVQSEMPRTRCPADTQLNNGACEKLIDEPVKTVCPPGFHTTHGHGKSDGSCEKLMDQLPSRRCPSGFILNGQECVSELRIPPTYICPKGTIVDGNRCLVEKFAVPQKACPPGLSMNAITHTCERDDVQQPLAECTKGTHYNPITRQCGTAHKIKEPNLACPPDYHFVGKDHCVKHLSEPPQLVCPPGFELLSKDKCVRREIKLPEGRCPFELLCEKGYVLEGQRCVTRTLKQPGIVCPPGFSLVDGRCLAKLQEQPAIACQEGSVPRHDANGLICIISVERPAQKTCPVTQRIVNDMCLEKVTTRPGMKCPPGFFEDLRTGRCFIAEETPQRDFCPVGFKLVNGQCIKQERHPLVPICPPGYQLTRSASGVSLCTLETIVPFMQICAFGFSLENNVCIAKKLQYEFDEAPEEAPAPQESQLPMNAPEGPKKEAPEQKEQDIEVTVNRPVVQKGLVMRNEPITLSGQDLAGVEVEYIPVHPATGGANLAALMAATTH